MQILGRVQSRNETRPTQNATRPGKLSSAEATSRRKIDQLSPMRHEDEAEVSKGKRLGGGGVQEGGGRWGEGGVGTSTTLDWRASLNTISVMFPIVQHDFTERSPEHHTPADWRPNHPSLALEICTQHDVSAIPVVSLSRRKEAQRREEKHQRRLFSNKVRPQAFQPTQHGK